MAAMTVAELIRDISVVLQDTEFDRWPREELCHWINEAVRAICLAKPSAATRSIVIPLVRGTLQYVPRELPGGGDLPLSLVRLVRNVNKGRLGNTAISIVGRTALDAQAPSWHDESVWPFMSLVRHYIFDEANPLEFYVFPGNDGTGQVEAVIAYCPALIEDGDYDRPLPLPEPYSVPIKNYVLAMALLKDDVTGNPGRAQMFLQIYSEAIGTKIDVEGANSPNANRLNGGTA